MKDELIPDDFVERCVKFVGYGILAMLPWLVLLGLAWLIIEILGKLT